MPSKLEEICECPSDTSTPPNKYDTYVGGGAAISITISLICLIMFFVKNTPENNRGYGYLTGSIICFIILKNHMGAL